VPGFDDALRGYAYPSTSAMASAAATAASTAPSPSRAGSPLSWDHLLPKGDARRDDLEYIVTSCMFCNVADNRYFDLAEKRGLHFDGLTPDEPVAHRLQYVQATRERYREFWTANVGVAGR
jgi:hypothetical protein